MLRALVTLDCRDKPGNDDCRSYCIIQTGSPNDTQPSLLGSLLLAFIDHLVGKAARKLLQVVVLEGEGADAGSG